jgi:hypothetical protein
MGSKSEASPCTTQHHYISFLEATIEHMHYCLLLWFVKGSATFYLAEAHQDFMTCTSVDEQCSQERDTTNYATGRFSARSHWQAA